MPPCRIAWLGDASLAERRRLLITAGRRIDPIGARGLSSACDLPVR